MSNPEDQVVEEMLVQLASGVRCTPGSLTLEGVVPSTLYFSDRPERVVGHVTTEQFVGDWGLGPDSFESDPPNAVVSFATGDAALEDAVVVLRSPKLSNGELAYQCDVLEGSLPEVAGACSLFIDPLGRPLSPISVCGMRRRERRRMRRRLV